MLWPTLNPDGQNEIAAWYRKNLGTPYEVSPLPDLYQEYVGHDNNRDGYMNNMLESRKSLARSWSSTRWSSTAIIRPRRSPHGSSFRLSPSRSRPIFTL